MNKTLCFSSLALVGGFFMGVIYEGRSAQAIYALSLSSQIIRQDTVLELLDKNDVAQATKVQKKYLEMSIIEAKSGSVKVASQAHQIIERR